MQNDKMSVSRYVPVYQNMAINALAFLMPGMKTVDWWSHIDSDGRVAFTHDEIIYKIDIKNIVVSIRTHQFLMYIISKYTDSVRQASTDKWIDNHLKITMSFEDIAKDFGMSLQATKPMVVQAVDFLYDLDIYAQWQRGRNKVFRRAHAVASYEAEINPVTRKGFITIVIDKVFAKFMSYMSVMQFPTNLWKVPPKNHTAAYQFAYYMLLNLKMNFKKRNRDCVFVQKLLACTVAIPKETSLGSAKQYRQRIMAPFVRELDLLMKFGILSNWQFVHNDTVVLHDEIIFMNYKEFIKSKVIYSFSGNLEQKYLKQAIRKAGSIDKGYYYNKDL